MNNYRKIIIKCIKYLIEILCVFLIVNFVNEKIYYYKNPSPSPNSDYISYSIWAVTDSIWTATAIISVVIWICTTRIVNAIKSNKKSEENEDLK